MKRVAFGELWQKMRSWRTGWFTQNPESESFRNSLFFYSICKGLRADGVMPA
jgi:hypothetical protein